MSTDPGLDRRLRAGLANAAEAVNPAVDSLLGVATARGRRLRSIRRAVVLAVVLAVAALPVGVITLTHRFGAANLTPAAPAQAALIGTWRTPSLPAADWLATYLRAGGSEAAGRAFLGPPMTGPASAYQIVLTVSSTEWAVFVSADGRDLEEGWHGTYRIGDRLVWVREASGLCEAAYRVTSSGGRLRIQVMDDGCGDSDLLAQRTIFETSAFAPG
jgi:hypothetical protein